MNLRTPTALLIALFTTIATTGCAPKIDNCQTIGACRQALTWSIDPKIVAIRKQIADGPADLAKQKAAAQKEGLSLTLDPSMPPANQNAAVSYQKWTDLQRARKLREPNYSSGMWYGYAYTPQQLDRIRQLLKAHQPEFDLLYRAINQPALVAPPGDLMYTVSIREAAKDMVMTSFLLAHDGHYDEAITNQALGFKISKQLLYRPTVMGYLTAGAIDQYTLSGFKNILYLAGPNAEVDTQVQKTIQASESLPSLRQALKGDVGISLYVAEKIRNGTPTDQSNFVQETLDPARFTQYWESDGQLPPSLQKQVSPAEREFVNDMLDAMEAHYLAWMPKAISAAGEPRETRMAALSAIASKMNATSPLSSTDLSGLSYLSDSSLTSSDAGKLVIMAAADLLCLKAKSGTFPNTLPSNFTDPFTNKPLGYHREADNGFVVYSVGPDRTFDGGKSGDKPGRNELYFRYPAPPRIPVPPENAQ